MTPKDLIRMSSALEVGLRSGQDWASILKWISENDSNEKVRLYFKKMCNQIKLNGAATTLHQEKSRFSEPLWSLFIEILLLSQKGAECLSKLMRSYTKLASSIVKLKEREKSLLFVPRFQGWGSLVMCFVFMVVLPTVAPNFFPSFLSQGRYDLFCIGVFAIALGLGIFHWLCLRPQRFLAPLLNVSFFFHFLAIFIESGLDLKTSWRQALEATPFSTKMRQLLLRKEPSLESMDDFLRNLKNYLKSPWPEILNGLLWAKASGCGLSDFLYTTAEQEGERLLYSWEDEVRKLTVLTLIPLGFIVFPSLLFLLMGPKLLELMQF